MVSYMKDRMVSVRVDYYTFAMLEAIGRMRGLRLSDVMREAIKKYIIAVTGLDKAKEVAKRLLDKYTDTSGKIDLEDLIRELSQWIEKNTMWWDVITARSEASYANERGEIISKDAKTTIFLAPKGKNIPKASISINHETKKIEVTII